MDIFRPTEDGRIIIQSAIHSFISYSLLGRHETTELFGRPLGRVFGTMCRLSAVV